MSIQTHIETAAAALSSPVDVRFGTESSFNRYLDGAEQDIVLFWFINSVSNTDNGRLKIATEYRLTFLMLKKTVELMDDTWDTTRFSTFDTIRELFSEFMERLSATIRATLGAPTLEAWTVDPVFNMFDANTDGLRCDISVTLYEKSYVC